MRALMWFRSDLRVGDNTALHQACRSATDGVVAVFAVCRAQWAEHGWGAAKVAFVLRHVRALAEALGELNIPLRIVETPRFEEAAGAIVEMARRLGCGALFYNREHEVNEQRRDEAVERLCTKAGIAVRACTDQTILDVSRVKSGSGGWYTVFTPFKRKWMQTAKEDGVPAALPRPRKQAPLKVGGNVLLGGCGDECGSSGMRGTAPTLPSPGVPGEGDKAGWPVGEREAQKRLRAFVARRVGDYHTNRDLPAEAGTSELSPYLACGALSPRQCLAAAMEANGGRIDAGRRGVVTWISELVWREFYRHILIGFPRVSMNRPFRLATERIAWREDEREFEAWCGGRTGVPIVDAGMRQLAQTGWMHNRVRMIVAMFLAKDLLIDWRWGERYFMEKLVDGDLANNNGGWQWCASTGSDAAPYFRIFNPFNQSRRYDPEGEYIRRFVPELAGVPAKALHDPEAIKSFRRSYSGLDLDRAACRQRALRAFKDQ